MPPVPARRSLAHLLLLLLCALQFACATIRANEHEAELRTNVELYRRSTPTKARIPGEVSTTRRQAASPAPMRLTASDGTGLALRRLDVRGVIDDPVALTELHLTFENPHGRPLDGQFELLLPPGAEVFRFAMRVGGKWVEAEVVERKHARQVYQEHKHIRRDPALLERESGRRFVARVFPIAPRERKQIILSYTTLHEQSGGVFQVPLAGLPRIDSFNLEIARREAGAEVERLELHREHEALDQDFRVALSGAPVVGLAAKDQALLRLVPIPPRPTQAGEQPTSLSLLVDTSASMAAAAEASEQAIAALLAALEDAGLGALPLELLAFDQTRAPLYRGTVAGAREPALAALRARTRLGASDLVAALDAVGAGVDRVILIGDGEVSAGADGRFELAAALTRAADRGLVRLDAIAVGRSADLEELEGLVHGAGLRDGVVFDAQGGDARVWVDDLLATSVERVDIAIPGAQQVWPASFSKLRPGQSVLVHASFAREAPAKVKVELSGAATRSEFVDLRRGDDPLVARSIALLQVKALLAQLDGDAGPRAEIEHEIVELSKRYGILGRHTAMLVLESEQAYADFGLERTRAASSAIDADNTLPVGAATSRDFTAVVDVMPTALHDPTSISLAGTTGAESRYALQSNSRRRINRSWSARVRGQRVDGRPAKLGKSVRATERELDEVALRCARHTAAMVTDDRVRHQFELTLALRFDADGLLVEVGSVDRPPDAMLECLRFELLELAGDALDQRPPNTAPAFELRHRLEVEIATSWGRAPAGWRRAEVLEFAREQAFAGQSGSAGWAHFIAEDIDAGLIAEALDIAWTWHGARPGELLPYVSLGRALVAAGELDEAARAYGSLIDIHPSRAETRRFAGALLESLDEPAALELAIDSYTKARTLRPDHPTGYQALALALAKRGDYQAAVDTLVDALSRTHADGRFNPAIELMRRDLALLSAAAILARPESRAEVLTQLVDAMIVPEAVARDSLILTWETDASHLKLEITTVTPGALEPRFGSLSQEVEDGFGPQAFEWASDVPGPLRVSVHADNLGPEGVALGSLRRVRFDGKGQLEFESRPFVIWPGQSRVNLGEFERD